MTRIVTLLILVLTLVSAATVVAAETFEQKMADQIKIVRQIVENCDDSVVVAHGRYVLKIWEGRNTDPDWMNEILTPLSFFMSEKWRCE